MAARKTTSEWERIEREYCGSDDSIREIADRNEISEKAIRNRAKADGWMRPVRTADLRGVERHPPPPASIDPEKPAEVATIADNGRGLVFRMLDELDTTTSRRGELEDLNIAGLPLHVLRDQGGVDVPAPDHPLYWLLHDSPNYDQSSFDFWEQMVEALEWRGNAYARMERTESGFLTSLLPISPIGMRVSRSSDGDLRYEWNDGGRQVARSGEILHIRGRGGDVLGGASTLATYRKALGLALVTESSAEAIFRNGARPSGTVTTAGKMTADQLDEFEDRMSRKWVGAHNAGTPMVLHSGLTWNKLTIDPVDAQMIDSRRLGIEIICQIFEVDPHLVGITSGNTRLGSSISDQTLSLVKFKMHKRLKRIEGALEKQLLSRDDRKRGVKIKFNLEGFLRADSLGRAQYYNLMKQFMTTNEIRALEGLPPVPGGDEIYRQVQDQPLGSRGIGDNGGPRLEEGE